MSALVMKVGGRASGAFSQLSGDGVTKTVPHGITSLTVTKAIVLVSSHNVDAAGRYKRHTYSYALDATNIVFTRSFSSSAVEVFVEWEIIEFSTGITVQHGTFDPGDSTEVSVAISSAPASRSVIFLGPQQSSLDGANVLDGYISNRSDDTHFEYTSGATTGTDVYNYQAWVFDADAITSLTRVELLALRTTATATITAVVDNDTLIVDGGAENVGIGQNRAAHSHNLNSTTQVESFYYQGTGSLRTTSAACIYVLEIPGLTVGRGTLSFADADVAKTATVTAGQTPFPATHKGNAYQSESGVAATASMDGLLFSVEVTSTTLTMTRGAAAQSYTGYWQAVDWSDLVAAGGETVVLGLAGEPWTGLGAQFNEALVLGPAAVPWTGLGVTVLGGENIILAAAAHVWTGLAVAAKVASDNTRGRRFLNNINRMMGRR